MKTLQDHHDDEDILLPTGVSYDGPDHPDNIDIILYPPGVGPAQEDRTSRDRPPLLDD